MKETRMNLDRRILALLCLMAFMVVCLPIAHAEIEEIQAISSHEGKLYAVSDYSSIFVKESDEWHYILDANETLELMTWEGDTCYFIMTDWSQDDAPLGVPHVAELFLRTATLSSSGQSMTLGETWSLETIANECNGSPQYRQMVVQDGQAYLLVQDPGRLLTNTLWKIDTTTGRIRKLTTGQIHGLNLWRDGTLLVQSDVEYATLNAIDVQTGRMTEMLALDSLLEDAAPAYDAANDTLYFIQNGQLMRWRRDETPEVCAVTGLAPDGWDAGQAVICGNEYVLLRDGKVYSFPTDEEMPEQTELVVEGFSVEPTLVDLFSGFTAQRTDVHLKTTGRWMGRDMIAQRLITHDPLPDIYHPYSDMGYANMARKGYFVDLSEIESIAALVDTMAPAVQALVKREDGALMGLPVEMRDSMSYCLNYNRNVLYAIGLTENDLPRTLEEMLDFIEEWGEKITDFYRDDGEGGSASYALFDADNGAYRTLVNTFLNTQLATLTREGKPMTLDNPALQQALKRLEGMREKLSGMELDVQHQGYGYLALFQTVPSALIFSDRDQDQPLFLSVDEEHDPVYPVSVRVMVINPYASASQQEIAKSFLAYTAENLNAWEHIKLCPDYSTPQFREDFPEEWEKAAGAVEVARADLEIAPEESRRTFEERLERAEAELERVEATRYAITPERIASIHAMSADFVPLLRTFEDTTAGSELLSRYIAGDIGTDAFLTQLERVLRMQEEEDR